MGTKVYDNYADLITFNRNSKGTALRPIGYGDELVTNGTFDTDSDWTLGTGWSISGGQLVATSATGSAFQIVSLTGGKVYQLSVENTANIQIRIIGGTGQSIGYYSGVDANRELFTFTAGAGSTLEIVANGTTTGFIDNVSVKEVLFDREGDPLTLFLHPEGVPRIEYDADRNLKGLLIEPDGQNICLQSEDINTTWNPSVATPTQSTEETPDGDKSNKYIKLVDDGSNHTGTGIVSIYQSINVSGGTKYTASIFAKADGVSFVRLDANGAGVIGDPSPQAFFGLSGAGVLGSKSAGMDDSAIEAYPNGWYRCSITWTQGAGDTNFSFFIRLASSISSVFVPLDGTSSIFVWGAQVEEGPIATSYMPTTISPFTRGKDEATMTNVSGLIGQKEGTLYVEVDWRLATGISQCLLSANDGSDNNRLLIYKDSSNNLAMYAKAGGSFVASQGVSSTGFSGIQKIAFAYKTDDFELYRNGSSIATATGSLAALATLTDIDLGQYYSDNFQANMHIRAVQIIPRRLSDEQLIELTS